MKKINIHRFLIAFIFVSTMLSDVYAQSALTTKNQNPVSEQTNEVNKYKVTFIELGSVRCIPCQKMQTVMKAIKKKYGSQVKVVFHDVWTNEGKPFGKQYSIEVIPTQIFLDENGKEFSRHEGYFPEDELVKVLKTKGVN
ncbi:MAG: thioredoxin family protein [Bacteroidia bacterium]|nr:thioredoxin family protein [Bacteroidia bacterium]